MTYYERLAVGRNATQEEIRNAYRRAARDAHPDRNVGSGAEARMAEINAAYRVLGDPARRRAYDAELAMARSGSTSASATWSSSAVEEDEDREPYWIPPVDVTPARFPWKFMAVLAICGIGVIIVGLIFSKPQQPAAPDNILRSADCVLLGPQLDAAEVACSGPHDAVVRVLVPFGDTCPGDTEGYRDRQGMGTACVVRVGP
jgi:hypothetical protein